MGGGGALIGGSQDIINTNKWGWDGQLELAVSKYKFVNRIVKTFLKHNNIFLKYAIKQFCGLSVSNS